MRSQGREKGTKEEAFSQASLFSSPTGPGQRLASGHSPTTGALTPEVSPPRGDTGSFHHVGKQACVRRVGAGGW